MYRLMVKRDFVAQHFLTVPNCGPENEWHSHHFTAEVLLEGPELNDNGYLVDIVAVEEGLKALIDRYRDATLNDLPEFEDQNPSVEHFAHHFCHRLADRLPLDTVEQMTVKLWEDDDAWASYALSLQD
jgi:6-pyruvoyltetrahydropterin/6-carboxytetrahydropterin synthase